MKAILLFLIFDLEGLFGEIDLVDHQAYGFPVSDRRPVPDLHTVKSFLAKSLVRSGNRRGLATFVISVETDFASQHDVHVVGLITLAEDHIASIESLLDHHFAQIVQRVSVIVKKVGDVALEVHS